MSRTVGAPSAPVTLLRVVPSKVCSVDSDGVAIVAYAKDKKFNKTIEGQQKKFGLSKEFNRFATLVVQNKEAGDVELSPIENAKTLKVTFNSKGRGFTGVMKRHNFHGGPGSHGHRFHRSTGSIGNAEWPGRVQRGKKMPGQYGNAQTTVKCQVVSFDKESNILVVKGSVSGANGGFGKIKVVL